MARSKQSKVNFAQGVAWYIDKSGNRKNVLSLDEANDVQSECCGIDCCSNKIVLPVNDSNGTSSYPAYAEFINAGGTIKLRVTVDLGAGYVTREVTLT